MTSTARSVRDSDDAELVAWARRGSADAYGELYARHVRAAYRAARSMSRSTADADDLVSESFTRVLDRLRAGAGPTSAFRAYLLTTLRNTAYSRMRWEHRFQPAGDPIEAVDFHAGAVSAGIAPVDLELTSAASAWASLPERWQRVLADIAIYGDTPAEIAARNGMTANGVSALIYRARRGLRRAYSDAAVRH